MSLKLWARKSLESYKPRSIGYSGRNLEDMHAERDEGSGGPFVRFQRDRGYPRNWAGDHSHSILAKNPFHSVHLPRSAVQLNLNERKWTDVFDGGKPKKVEHSSYGMVTYHS